MKNNKRYKTITLWQPYATLIAIGAKKYETRSWHPGNRLQPGEVLMIHAAKRKLNKADISLMASPLVKPLLDAAGYTADNLPLGVIVAAVRFVGAYPTDTINVSEAEAQIGNYNTGRYAWKLETIRVPDKPIPALGRQGIWYWDGKPQTPSVETNVSLPS